MSDTGVTDALMAARAAVARADWRGALGYLGSDEGSSGADVAERLELLATAAYGAGEYERAVAAWEDLHRIEVARGRHAEAAWAGAMVAMYVMMDAGLMSPVRGWLGRVDRLLADHEETPAHALAAMVRGYERFMCGDMEQAGVWAARAVDLGTRLDVPPAAALGRVCGARLRIFAGDLEEGLAALDETAVSLLTGELDPLTTGMVYCELICAMQGLSHFDRAEEWTAAMDVRRVHGDFHGGINGRCRVHRAELLRIRGDHREAEAEALRACEELRPWMRREYGWPLTELGTIRLRRGDLDGAEEAFLDAVSHGWDPQPGLALLRLATGELEEAAALITDALDRPPRIPWKERPPSVALTRAPLLAARVEIACAAGEPDVAAEAAEELAAIARTFTGRALEGAATLAAARVALAAGRLDDAVTAAKAAVDAWCEVGARYEAAAARLVVAAAQRADGAPGLADVEEAAAREMLSAIGAAEPGVRLAAAVGAPTAAGDAVFRCDGGTRVVTFAGRTVLLRDLKGMRYLARLLAEPGREVHALDLVAGERDPRAAAPGHLSHEDAAGLHEGAGDAGPLLDETAKRAYQRRLAEVEEDIADAEAAGDVDRAALAERDRDFLVAELSRAFGLGGRARTAGDAGERARVSVTRAIRYALDRIAAEHPELGEHLDRTVRTGQYCAYDPGPDAGGVWET